MSWWNPPTPGDLTLPPSVLVVDAHSGLSDRLRAAMAADGVEFFEVAAGLDPLATVRACVPSVVLLDLDIPGAMQLLRRIKDDAQVGQTPVLALAGGTGSEHKLAAFDLGAADCLAKPFELMELRARLRATLRVHDLLRMLSHRAHLDGLTGLWNRTHFDERWGEEHSRAARSGHALSLAMIDIDLFKLINDKHGHPVGDVVLRGVAACLQRALRQTDLCCRFGGEEFGVIMPDTAPAEAAVVAERVRVGIELLVWSGLGKLRTTVSIGIAGLGAGHRGPLAQSWIDQADRALYAAKENGRNRIELVDVGQDRAKMAG